MVLMLGALAVVVWKAAVGNWLAVITAVAALAPAGLLWQFHHYIPKPRRRSYLRVTLALTATGLVVLAVAD